jgi:hypothetical protein
VNVIWHEASGEDRQRHMIVRFCNEPQKGAVVGAIMEALQLIVAAIDDVIAMTRDDGARRSRHGASVGKT